MPPLRATCFRKGQRVRVLRPGHVLSDFWAEDQCPIAGFIKVVSLLGQ